MFRLSRVLLLAVAALCLTSCTTENRPNFVPGETAPDFSLRDVDGTKRSLSEFKGKVVLLNFWATWCGPCVSELPALERVSKKLESKGLVVVGVVVDDDRDSAENFKRAYGLTFATPVDVAGHVKRTYELTGVPESFFLDRDGKFVLMADPQTNDPVVRIVGPRQWDSPNALSRINALLSQ